MHALSCFPQILAMEVDDAGLEMFFTAEQEFGGSVVEVELVPGGRDIPVSDANKEEYAALITSHKMCSSIRSQTNAFLEGFQASFSSLPLLSPSVPSQSSSSRRLLSPVIFLTPIASIACRRSFRRLSFPSSLSRNLSSSLRAYHPLTSRICERIQSTPATAQVRARAK